MGPPGPLGQGWALCVRVSFRPHPKTMSQRMVYQTSHTASHHTHMETRTRTHTHKTMPVLWELKYTDNERWGMVVWKTRYMEHT